MVAIKWTKNDLEELDDMGINISRDSPKYVNILIKQISEMISHLEQFPKIGRNVPEHNAPNL